MRLGMLTIICSVMLACTHAYGEDQPPLQVVEQVDLERYLGTWYEIASIPQRFQRNCYGSQAQYSTLNATTIRVINSCRKGSFTGPLSRVRGKAFVVDTTTNAKLEVQFFWPFRGDYWIIELDEDDYQYAVVGHPDRDYLWILSREPQMAPELFDTLMDRIEHVHLYDPTLIERSPQPES